jgi:threonine aldolase
MENEYLKEFGEKVAYTFWEKYDDTHTVIRLATDWGTADADVDALIDIL